MSGKADIGELNPWPRDGLGRSGHLTHLVRRNSVAKIDVVFRCVSRVFSSRSCVRLKVTQPGKLLRSFGRLRGWSKSRVGQLRRRVDQFERLKTGHLKRGWIERRNIRIDVRWSTPAVDWTRREDMAISLSVLSVACFIGAAISFLRYDSKYFDLLVLSGVIFIGTAMPSFEVDASLEELKSINHNLVSIQTAMENLQRK